jgi:hypothetical protein
MSTVRDPARLVADASVSDAELTLLRHGIDIAPPPGAEARVWQGLAGALGAAAIGGAAAAADASTKTVTTAATKVTGAGLTGAKIVALVAALAGLASLAVLGAKLLPSANHPRPPAEAPPVAAAEPAAVAAPPTEQPPAEAAPAPRPNVKKVRAPARPGGATPASSAGRLREETTLVRDARQALRQGDAARALRLLDECRRLFPAGVLQQERERLAIEALTRSGRGAEASARAAAFLRKYPDSPHAAEIRALGR